MCVFELALSYAFHSKRNRRAAQTNRPKQKQVGTHRLAERKTIQARLDNLRQCNARYGKTDGQSDGRTDRQVRQTDKVER